MVRGKQEYARRARKPLCDLRCALNVDVEEELPSALPGILQLRERRPVQVAVHLGPFQKPASVAYTLELDPIDEVVFDPVALVRPRRTGRMRDRKRQRWFRVENGPDDRGLPRSRWP